ncbi:MAG: ABC transporter permease subunit [Proteobacteria bacterium]|nr:ABC transporter permease subunit [Pseudomonadota bacterium]
MNPFARLIYHEKTRPITIQCVCLVAFLVVTATLVYNAGVNLKEQGVASGFGFLFERSGFSINQMPISYTEDSSYFRAFLVGLLNSIIVSFLGIIIATVLGFFIAICRLSSNFLLSKLAMIYVEILRNLPLLLQIFFWYFVILAALPSVRESYELFDTFYLNNRGINIPRLVSEPASGLVLLSVVLMILGLFGYHKYINYHHMQTGKRLAIWPAYLVSGLLFLCILWLRDFPYSFEVPKLGGFNFEGGLVLYPEFLALLFSLSLYTAAFIAEIVRAGILAVPKGQVEAAKSLGLSHGVTLTKVVIPQAMRVIVPPLTSQYLNLTKNSSLAAAIGYPELVSVFAGTVLNQTGQAVEVIALVMSVYLTLSLSLSAIMNLYNKKIQLTER